jgi:REP element-mobilizing transposase RayT
VETVPRSYRCLIYHLVFATKHREPLIDEALASELYRYVSEIIRNKGGFLYEAGGMPDHIHLLLSWSPAESLASLAQAIKSRSSGWIHRAFPGKAHFNWQDGYSVFSVSQSRKPIVERYIQNQAAIHAQRSYVAEMEWLARTHPSPEGTLRTSRG